MPETAEIHSAIPDLPVRIIRNSYTVPMPPGSKEPPRAEQRDMVEYMALMPGPVLQKYDAETGRLTHFDKEAAKVEMPYLVSVDAPSGVCFIKCLEMYDSLRAQLTQVAKERDEFAKLWDDVCHERDDLKTELGKRKK